MTKYWLHIGLYILCFAGSTNVLFCQEVEPQQEVNIDDLGNVSDEFQENFFEALKQKAITNYEKAIEALQKCIALDDTPLILYAELGKNHLELQEYEKAEENFKKVLDQKPDDRYLLELLYQTYFKQGKYSECVTVVEKLVTFDSIFKEQLANLYFLEERYDDALNLVDELEEEYGSDPYRKQLRRKISLKITNPDNQIVKLEKNIEQNPKEEQNYLNLIYLYSQDNQKEKAYETAKKLLKTKPTSELVHLALYKFYLDDSKTEDAINSMKITLASKRIDQESKFKVINDFLIFVDANPQFEPQFIEITKSFSADSGSAKVFTEIGNYFYEKGNKELALNFYERGLVDNVKDFAILRKMLLLQLDLGRFDKAKVGSELALEMYPSQPILYLVNGVALNNLGNFEEAIEILSIGIDYIIDDTKMESDFYEQIGKAYDNTGNNAKAEEYKKKSVQLKQKS